MKRRACTAAVAVAAACLLAGAPVGSVSAASGPRDLPGPAALGLPRAHGVNADAGEINLGRKRQASGVTMRSDYRRVSPQEVLPSGRTLVNGCAAGYGHGVVCLPVVPPSQAEHAGHGMQVAWTCAEVRTLLPRGLSVDGPDYLGLDGNKDGTACGESDV